MPPTDWTPFSNYNVSMTPPKSSPLLKLLLTAMLFIVVGLVVRAVYLPQKAIADVKRLGGRVQTTQGGPEWLRKIAGPQIMVAFDRATVVNLSGTELKDADLEVLSRLKGVERLNLAHTPITDDGLRHLSRLTGLKALDLGGTRVTDEGLAHLTKLQQLEFLYLENTRISDAGLPRLEHLQNLRTLAVEGTGVTDEGVRSLWKALPDLDEIRR